MLQINPQIITLKGLTLKSSLSLTNPNQILAVIFEIQQPLINNTTSLYIQPKRGIILPNQTKNISLWIKNQDRQQLLRMPSLLTDKKITINMTRKAEYNRKNLQKLNIRGWQTAKKSFESINIPITISKQVFELRSQLKQEASNSLHKMGYSNQNQYMNELGQQKRYSSNMKNNMKNSQGFKVGQMYSYNRSLSKQRQRQKSKQKYKQSQPQIYRTSYNSSPNSKKILNTNKISQKLDRQLDFLFQNQISKQFNTNQHNKNNSNRIFNHDNGQNVHYITNNLISPNKYKQQIVTYQNQYNSNRNNKNILGQSVQYYNKQANDQRFLQFIMLAALAGFFAALGSNFKNLIS